jgi:hypothetical protein
MKNNPQQNVSFEKAPKNEIDGVLQAYLFTTQQAVASASRALFPIVDQEMRRIAQANANKPVPPVAEAAPARPTASEMLAQVAAVQPVETDMPNDYENLLAEPDDDESDVASHLRAVDAIHAEIEAERGNRGDYDRAA